MRLTELLVRASDLAEAEGRVLRAMTIRVALGVSTIIVAAGAVTAGVVLLLAAVFIATRDWQGNVAAAVVTGAAALGIGGALAWLGRRIGT